MENNTTQFPLGLLFALLCRPVVKEIYLKGFFYSLTQYAMYLLKCISSKLAKQS